MTQDVLAEALRPLLAWAEAVSQHHAMLRTEPPFTTTQALKEALASAYAALVRTPETLDEESVRRVIVEWLGPQRMSLYSSKDIDRMVTGAIVYSAATRATPSPAPPEGLREGMGAVEAAWFALARDFTYTGPHDRETAHDIVVQHRPAIEAALRASPAPDPGAGLREAATVFLIAADNASLEALVDAEDGAEVPDWQERLWDAADVFRAALAPSAEPPETET